MRNLTLAELQELLNSPPSKLIIPTLDRRRKIYRKIGWIYVLRNPGLGRKYLKIGMTSRFPEKRALELSQSTAVPTPFQLVYYVHVGDRYQAEQHAHAELQEYRLANNKEFFITSISKAVRSLNNAAEKFPVYTTTSRGRVNGILPQDIQPHIVDCPHCGRKIRVRMLLIPTVMRCGYCNEPLN